MEKKMSTSTTKTKDMVTTAMFVAIILAMSFVPYLGYIPLGFMNATIIHIPVIIGAILLGPARGAFLGGIFGLTSMINNTFNPNLTSFVFSPFYSLGNVHGNFKSLMICFVPRILIGVVAYYVYTGIVKLVKKKKNDGKGSAAALAAAGAAGGAARWGGHLQRADLFRRRNAGPHRPRMEISRRISPQPGTALFGAKRIPGYCYLMAGYEQV